MNLASRIALALSAMGLMSSGFWAFLAPHFLYQFALIFGASGIFGGAMFSITASDEDEVDKELKEQEAIAESYEQEDIFSERFSESIEDFYNAARKIVNPKLNRKFDKIYKIALKINDYGKENDCQDKLNVWNNVYVPSITKLIKDFNKLYSIQDQSKEVLDKIEEFTNLSDEIENNFKRQYDDLVSGKIQNFAIDMTLIKQIHEMKE